MAKRRNTFLKRLHLLYVQHRFSWRTPSQPPYTVFDGKLNLDDQLKDIFILKDIQVHKVERRFYASNFTHFTTFRIYLHPLQNAFKIDTYRSLYTISDLHDMNLQGKVVKDYQWQEDCYYTEIIDIVLDREMLQVTYLEESDHPILHLHPPIPRFEDRSECIQARVHVPSYIYKLNLTSFKEMRAMLHIFPSRYHKAFVESSKKLLSWVEFIFLKGGDVYYDERKTNDSLHALLKLLSI